MFIENAYTHDPIKFNNLSQARKVYAGIDSLESPVLPKDTIISTLSGPERSMLGDYFTPYEGFQS